MPSMSTSGNINPTSRSMIRPSTSMQAQLRPISPSPPRNVTETGEGISSGPKRPSGVQVRPDFPGALLGAGGRRSEREAALAHRKAEGAHHRLGGLREHARFAVLEREGLRQPVVDLAGVG